MLHFSSSFWMPAPRFMPAGTGFAAMTPGHSLLHRHSRGSGHPEMLKTSEAALKRTQVPILNKYYMQSPPTPLAKGGEGDCMLRCDPRGHEGWIATIAAMPCPTTPMYRPLKSLTAIREPSLRTYSFT
jgi:hypothetical protein